MSLPVPPRGWDADWKNLDAQARSDRRAEQALADQQVILDYVEAHPGVTAQEVISHGRGHLSRSSAEKIIKDLLYHEPKQLRSEHPAGTHAFGRGQARLYVA